VSWGRPGFDWGKEEWEAWLKKRARTQESRDYEDDVELKKKWHLAVNGKEGEIQQRLRRYPDRMATVRERRKAYAIDGLQNKSTTLTNYQVELPNLIERVVVGNTPL
jgi:hypothetical protein